MKKNKFLELGDYFLVTWNVFAVISSVGFDDHNILISLDDIDHLHRPIRYMQCVISERGERLRDDVKYFHNFHSSTCQ